MTDNPKWCVKDAELHEDFTIDLLFEDGSHRIFDMKPLLEQNPWRQLKKVPRFLTGRVEYHTVVWTDTIDIAPELLYSKSTLVA